jgi:gamma-glutamyltranspeptidase
MPRSRPPPSCASSTLTTSLGGDAFWLIHDARTGAVRSLEAAGRAAAAATPDWFAARGLREIPVRGIVPGTLTVPGAVDGWFQAHAAYGRLPLATDLAAAVGYARDGFPVTRRLAEWIERSSGVLAADPAAARIFLGGGPRPAVGRRLANPDLARTLERAAVGRAGFYEGETAREMARHAREHGGFYTERDFAAQHAKWGDSIHATYRGVTIHETPPPSRGGVGAPGAPPPRAVGDRRAAVPGAGSRAPAGAGQADRLTTRTASSPIPSSRGPRRAVAVPGLRGGAPGSRALRARCPGTASRRAAP